MHLSLYTTCMLLFLYVLLNECIHVVVVLLCYKSYKLDLWWTKKVRFCWSRIWTMQQQQ
jgi:hypothetical protein